MATRSRNAQHSLHAGCARANITPYVGCPLAGFAARKEVSHGIHDELFAKALALELGSSSTIIVAMDLIGISTEMVSRIRKGISERTGVRPDSILLAASHTHSGPAIVAPYGELGLAHEHYRATLVDDVTGAAVAAWISRTPASLGWSSVAVTGIGVNRRTANGLPVDPEAGVLRIAAANDSFKAVLVNYACHAVTLGPSNLLISADYPGYATRAIERLYGDGTTCLFTNGAAGDVNTGHSAELSALGYDIPGRTFERAESLGRRLAGAVVTGVELAEAEASPVIRSTTRRVRLDRKRLPSLEEATADWDAKKGVLDKLRDAAVPEEELVHARVEELYASLLVQRIRELDGTEADEAIDVEVQGIRLGSAALLAVPVELFVTIGLNVKKSSPVGRTYICGYSNGSYGYLPSREAFDEGGYETVSSRFAPQAAESMEKALVEVATELSVS